ncbi:MAG: hypothetical protein HYT78_10625 [Deltaproteobacteria bacterium]|nr:hypothetical protein [Deltaproteobacteria bacterium]
MNLSKVANVNPYLLIDLDKGETSKLRRTLDPWQPAKAHAVTRLVGECSLRHGARLEIKEPRWETNIYPLYYYFWDQGYRGRKLYNQVIVDYKRLFPELASPSSGGDLYYELQRSTDAEIDLLIEDRDYFIFAEVKDPPPGKKAKFETRGGIHQLVRQFVQGKLLGRLIRKEFLLCTVGVGLCGPLRLNDVEKGLLAAVGGPGHELDVQNFDWDLLG